MTNLFNNLETKEAEIAEYLYEYHRGISHAVSNKRLTEAMGLDERTSRDIVAKIITVDHIPIGSCSTNHTGIFFCNSDEDYKIASDEDMSRIKKLAMKHKGRRLGWQEWKNGIVSEQLELIKQNI